MAYFSRLTDIVTCNLTSLLARAEDAGAALEDIIREMHEGVAGAERSVRTAMNNVARIESEIGEQRAAVGDWLKRAQDNLKSGQEALARQALERKHEVEDLIAGLEQQLHAAVATRDHLQTMMNALQARLADARRRLGELHAGVLAPKSSATPPAAGPAPGGGARSSRVDAELEELRRQLGPG
jgi:phage shock protein A